MSESSPPDSVWIFIPVYNDWESVRLLLPAVAKAIGTTPDPWRVLLVDDGSSMPAPAFSAALPVAGVSILHLQRNVGHQRAICIGLCHLYEHSRARRIVVMDGDGEDDPEDIPRLVAAVKEGPVARHLRFGWDGRRMVLEDERLPLLQEFITKHEQRVAAAVMKQAIDAAIEAFRLTEDADYLKSLLDGAPADDAAVIRSRLDKLATGK